MREYKKLKLKINYDLNFKDAKNLCNNNLDN